MNKLLFPIDGPAEPPPHVAAILANPPKSEQAENLDRVGGKVKPHVLDFCEARIDQEFTIDELELYCHQKSGCAFGSGSRILRLLARPDKYGRAAIKYRVTNRAQSRYRVIDVERTYAS